MHFLTPSLSTSLNGFQCLESSLPRTDCGFGSETGLVWSPSAVFDFPSLTHEYRPCSTGRGPDVGSYAIGDLRHRSRGLSDFFVLIFSFWGLTSGNIPLIT